MFMFVTLLNSIKILYLFTAEKRKLELAEKFQYLQKSGAVDTYMAKRKKKNMKKDKKTLPADFE